MHRSRAASSVMVAGLCLAAAQPVASQLAPKFTSGYVATMEIQALAPEIKTPAQTSPEAQALLGKLRSQTNVKTRAYLAETLSRHEILSTDFILPAGTVVLHDAGARFYVIADPEAKTYVVMDSEHLLTALEGGAGIINSRYAAAVRHTDERKTCGPYPCRKSIVTVTYASSIPLENDRILVQQKNDVEVWHTSRLVSGAALDHLFFKFQRDKTGAVQQVVSQAIGFPMEIKFVVTQAGGTKKPAAVQAGSFHMTLTDFKVEKKLDAELFRIPPAGYRKLERNPYFK